MTRSRAFTLLELLMATALMSILMLGVLTVLTPANRMIPPADANDSSSAAADSQSPALEALVRLLADDVSHAQSVDVTRPGEISLLTYAGLDDAARQETHRPVRILYLFQEVASHRWLIRRQTALDVPTNQNIQRDLVGTGIARFELIRTEIPARQLNDEPGTAWKLMLWTDSTTEPAINRIIAIQSGIASKPSPSGAGAGTAPPADRKGGA